MRAEVVHKQVVSVVDEKVQGVEHVPVVLEHRHLERRLNDLVDLGLSLFAVMYKFNALLLVLLPHQVGGLLD